MNYKLCAFCALGDPVLNCSACESVSVKPDTPGTVLKLIYMPRFDLTQIRLAELIGVHRRVINKLIKEKQRISADLAIRFSKVFGTDPRYWLNLQADLDLWKACNENDYSNIQPE